MSGIEYFYSAHSTFAYLGSRRFMGIAAASGRKIVHKPYYLNRAIVGVGSVPTRKRPQNHRAYYFRRQIDRWAEHREAPVMEGYPTEHWANMTLANCMLIAAARADADANSLAHLMLQGHWRDNADLSDRDTLVALAWGVDVDPDPLLTAAETPEINAVYEANTDEAIERSVLGSPTYFVDGDMFYGQGHLELVERALQRPYKPSNFD